MNSVFKHHITRLSSRTYRWSVGIMDETMAGGYEPTRQKAINAGVAFIHAALAELKKRKMLTTGDNSPQSAPMIGNHQQTEGAPQ